jgi:acetoin utilization deacetylase AcuC-like enzyme
MRPMCRSRHPICSHNHSDGNGKKHDTQLISNSQTGTLLAAELALDRGLAVSTAGGTHHAFAGHGSGFCILNDLALTALELQRRGDVTRVLILDLDVHQVWPSHVLKKEVRGVTNTRM